MHYKASTYVCDDTTAIRAISHENSYEVTWNLFEYGMMPINNEHIYIPAFRFECINRNDILKQIFEDLVERVIAEVIIDSNRLFYVKLKANWRDLCEGTE